MPVVAPPAAPAASGGLPTITVPRELPCFIEPHAIDEDSVYAQVPFATGHSRARRVWTVPERVVSVAWLLEADQMAAIDDWYENALLAGARQFSVEVRNQNLVNPANLWWTARWVDYQTEMMHLGRGRVSGHLLLTGEGSATGPDTSVMAMEVVIALLDTRSYLSVPQPLAMEISIALRQTLELAMEVSIALLDTRTAILNGALLREGSGYILREDGFQILRE